MGETAPAWLNAANEIAVESFLQGTIDWMQISEVIQMTLNECDGNLAEVENDIYAADKKARTIATAVIEKL